MTTQGKTGYIRGLSRLGQIFRQFQKFLSNIYEAVLSEMDFVILANLLEFLLGVLRIKFHCKDLTRTALVICLQTSFYCVNW